MGPEACVRNEVILAMEGVVALPGRTNSCYHSCYQTERIGAN